MRLMARLIARTATVGGAESVCILHGQRRYNNIMCMAMEFQSTAAKSSMGVVLSACDVVVPPLNNNHDIDITRSTQVGRFIFMFVEFIFV